MNRGAVLDSLKSKCLLLDETLNGIGRDFATSSVKRDRNQMVEYLSGLVAKYSALCKTIQDIDEDLKKISTKVRRYEVTKFLDELKNKHEELEMNFKKQKAYLLTSKSLIEEPVGRLDAKKVLDDAVNQYKKLMEQFKRSCLTGDIMTLKSKISVYDGEKGSFFRRVSNIILNLWNKIVSYFSSNASLKVSPEQSCKEVVIESEVKVKSTETMVIEKKLDDVSVDYAEQNERIGFRQSNQRGI